MLAQALIKEKLDLLIYPEIPLLEEPSPTYPLFRNLVYARRFKKIHPRHLFRPFLPGSYHDIFFRRCKKKLVL